MALLFGEHGHAPVFDGSTSMILRRRLGEFLGAALMVTAAALALALGSYDVSDPSHFSSTPQPPANWLGRPGAMIADPMMRVFGIASWGFAIWLAVWGWRFVAHRGEQRIWLRLPLAPIAIIIGMVFASLHPPSSGWPLATGLGGIGGDGGVIAFLDLLPLPPDEAVRTLTLGLGGMLLLTGGIALGLSTGEAWAILRWLVLSVVRLGRMAFGAAAAGASAAWRLHRERQARPRSERLEPAEPTGNWRDSGQSAPRHEEGAAEPAPREPAGGIASYVSRLTLPRVVLPKVDIFSRREPSPAAQAPAGTDEGGEQRRELASAIRKLRSGEPPRTTNRISGFEEEAAAEPQPEPRVRHAAPKPARKSRRAREEAQPTLFDGKEHDYECPPLALLQPAEPTIREHESDAALEENARMLETVLEDYGVRGEITAVKAGPVVTLYELEPAPGLKASRVIGLADDIARSMSALSARIATVPGRSVIGIELPNARREKVLLRDLFESAAYGDSREKLALALGKDIAGAPVIADLSRMPHLLIAGTTGSGKSVAINTMILSLLYRMSPEDCRLIMIDPKMLELSVYDNIPHLLSPVVTDPKKAVVALKWVVSEMEERYRKMSKMGVRNIDGYNARVRDALDKGEEFSRTVHTGFDEETGDPVYETETFEPEEMPFIVVIVDEMADLMMVAGKEIEACIQRLAQMARASGIHLIMATQRPSVDVITGTIKANFPTRISFQVTSKIDSRTILGEQGAEQLLGQGDMLYMAGGGRITRVHGPFVSDEEVEEVVAHLKALGSPDYVGAVTEGGDDETQSLVDEKLGLAPAGDGEDALYDQAVAIVARDRKCSTSYIQRKLAIGYNKAARLVEQMETQGVVSAANAVGKREIMIEER